MLTPWHDFGLTKLKLTFSLSFSNLCLHFFFRIWLKTKTFRVLPLKRKDNYQCFSTARDLGYHYPCCSSFLDNFILAFFFLLPCVNHGDCVVLDRKWFGRFLGEISARKWEAICTDFNFLWLVFPKGQMSRCACS